MLWISSGLNQFSLAQTLGLWPLGFDKVSVFRMSCMSGVLRNLKARSLIARSRLAGNCSKLSIALPDRRLGFSEQRPSTCQKSLQPLDDSTQRRAKNKTGATAAVADPRAGGRRQSRLFAS